MVRGSVSEGSRRTEFGVTELIALGLATIVLSLTFPALQLGVASGQVIIVTEEPDGEPSPVASTELWPAESKDGAGMVVARDDFKGGPFLDWQIVRPQPDHVSFTRTPGCLTITTQRGTIHADEENDTRSRGIKAKNLFLIRNPLADEGDGAITLHVKSFKPITTYQQVGLLCYNDDDNYLKWSYEFGWRSSETCLTLVRETNEDVEHDLIVKFNAPDELWLRVIKSGNEYECAYSTDGKTFEVAGKLPWGDGAPKYIGFLAKNGGNPKASEIDACFESFEVRKGAPARVRAVPAARVQSKADMVIQSKPGDEVRAGDVIATEPADKKEPAKSQGSLMERLAEELDAAAEKIKKATVRRRPAPVVREDPAAARKRQAKEQRDRLTKDEKWQPTHEQESRIEVGTTVNNYCLDSKGRVLACCGDSKIRVYSQEGKLVETWKLDFAPQAIGLRKADGNIFVGGEGKLARLNASGEVEQQESFPRAMTEEEIEAAVQEQVKSQAKMFEDYLRGLKGQLKTLEKAIAKTKKADDKPTDKKEDKEKEADPFGRTNVLSCIAGTNSGDGGFTLEFKEDTPLTAQLAAVKEYLKMIDHQYGGKDKLEEKLRERMSKAAESVKYTGIAVAEKDLFVIASAPGYTYNAWRAGHDMKDAELIVKGLRGCCGQMDCQTHDGDLWIPMNTQHKVCRYDRDGKLVSSFGKRGQEIAEAFGGCCEPKNLRFGEDGFVYCAESGPPVCVKRFTLEGEFKDTVCLPLYETGCVRVSVDLWEDKVFLLSPSENAIYLFSPKKKG